MLCTIFTANQIFPHTFTMGEVVKLQGSLQSLSELVLESMSIVDTLRVTTNHLVKSHFLLFLLFFRIQFNLYIILIIQSVLESANIVCTH